MINKIIKVLKDKNCRFRLAEAKHEKYTCFGLHQRLPNGDRLILIDPIECLIDTILHECLHDISPCKERDIQGAAEVLVKTLSRKKKEQIYNLFIKRTKEKKK